MPSHGIGLTPDEKGNLVMRRRNSMLHVFDATVMPPKKQVQRQSQDQPGWISFSLDGRFAYPSTGQVIDTRTKKIWPVQDELGRQWQREVTRNRLRQREADRSGSSRLGRSRSAIPVH